jgi:hypothetical protein
VHDRDARADDSLAGALRALGAAPTRDDVDAGFFHRTLARWLGLPEGRAPSTSASSLAPVEWDYGFWKAELVRDGSDIDDAGRTRERWSAVLFRVADDVAERVAWTVTKDARGAIVDAAWLTPAPRLIDDGHGDGEGSGARPLDAALLARLDDDGGDGDAGGDGDGDGDGGHDDDGR